MSIADLRRVYMRPSHASASSAACPPRGWPPLRFELGQPSALGFLRTGYSPSQRRANVYKVQVNLVEKSMPLALPQIPDKVQVNLVEKSSVFPIPL